MPYNIWCGGCKKHIGMGVRYNAEKTKVGMYYTTPVYQFRMKCHLCTNHFEIKTDPANLDYVIVSGATRQERRWDPTQNGQVVPDDKAVGRKLADDAMYKLEHVSKDSGKAKEAAPRIGKITSIQDRVKDDYLANRILRDQLRAKKKEARAQAEVDNKLLAKASLDMDLVEERDSDVRMAQLLSIQAGQSSEERQKDAREEIASSSIFKVSSKSGVGKAGTSNVSGGKQRSLDTIRKIVKTKQGSLVKEMMFGVVVKKGDRLKESAIETKVDAKTVENSQSDAPVKSVNSESVESLDETAVVDNIEEGTTPNSNRNSLSLLSCDYGDSSSNSS